MNVKTLAIVLATPDGTPADINALDIVSITASSTKSVA